MTVPSPSPPSTQLLPCATLSFSGAGAAEAGVFLEALAGDLLRPREADFGRDTDFGAGDFARDLRAGVERSAGGLRTPAPERRLERRMVREVWGGGGRD